MARYWDIHIPALAAYINSVESCGCIVYRWSNIRIFLRQQEEAIVHSKEKLFVANDETKEV